MIISRLTEPEIAPSNSGADQTYARQNRGRSYGQFVDGSDLIRFGELSWLDQDSPNLEEIAIDALPKKYLNRSLSDLEIRQNTRCNEVGFRNARGQLMINPPADMKLESHSKLIVLGDGSAIGKLNAMFDLD